MAKKPNKKPKKKPTRKPPEIEYVSSKGLPVRVMQRLADKINEIINRLNDK